MRPQLPKTHALREGLEEAELEARIMGMDRADGGSKMLVAQEIRRCLQNRLGLTLADEAEMERGFFHR